MNVSFELAVPSNGHALDIILYNSCSESIAVDYCFILDMLSFLNFCNTTGEVSLFLSLTSSERLMWGSLLSYLLNVVSLGSLLYRAGNRVRQEGV